MGLSLALRRHTNPFYNYPLRSAQELLFLLVYIYCVLQIKFLLTFYIIFGLIRGKECKYFDIYITFLVKFVQIFVGNLDWFTL